MEMTITGVRIVADCFDPEHPHEEALSLIKTINGLLTKLGGDPIINYDPETLTVDVAENRGYEGIPGDIAARDSL